MEKSSILVDIPAAVTPISASNRLAVLEMIEEEDELVVVDEDEHVENVFIEELPPPQPRIQQQLILPEIGSGVYSPIDRSQDDGDVGRTSGATELEASACGSSSDGYTDDALVSVLFILEPMFPSYQIDSVRSNLGFEIAFSLATIKIWVFCKNGLSLRLLESSDQVLHFEAMHGAVPLKFLLSVVYAKSSRNRRWLLWQNMVDFRLMYSAAPWMIGGDFNVIRTLDEYSGNSVQDPVAMIEFNECILECDLLELPAVGE
ncbi:OLC1v1036381C1, partial [Oldenlandia corymbosa var. corymbosa]